MSGDSPDLGLLLAKSTYHEIINAWDRGWKICAFPHMGTTNHWGFAKARLSAFQGADEWLTVFEILVFQPGLGNFEIIGYGFGNKLKGEPKPLHFIEAAPLQILEPLDMDDEDDWWCRDPFNLTVLHNGNHKQMAFSAEQYLEAGIDLALPISGDECFDRVLRVLC
jgi:hypothetical protein